MADYIKIAHVDDKDPKRVQILEDHQINVARLAGEFAAEFGMSEWGFAAGYYHDIGKARDNFQSYIRKVSGNSPDADWHGADKSHAYIGAKLVKEDLRESNPILSLIVMGHHSGLDDFQDFCVKMQKSMPELDYQKLQTRLTLPNTIIDSYKNSTLHHLIRILYSCLVDADFLDTEKFMNPQDSSLRKDACTIADLAPKLDNYLLKLKTKRSNTKLNETRQSIQDLCRKAASDDPGFYSLTVPTGGGKTLSSLVWAINHCVKHGKKRIIIAIPYTTIITQTAKILSEIFGEENVLEHHSELNPEDVQDPKLRKRLKLASDNWDFPIVVTTNVRLFESMMSNRPSKCRRLHNIANSVIILDEVQTLPLHHLQPIIDSLTTYQKMFSSSVLFTTASLPALKGDMRWTRNGALRGIEEIKEIIPKDFSLHKILRRTAIHVDDFTSTSSEIADRIAKESKVLCVVNTRRLAKEIYDNLPEEGLTLHLSRLMCSEHIHRNLIAIKEALAADDNVRVIATQLIEAGVDIDFPVVYRQSSGLDSIIQAAGRCNREGRLEVGDVYVFNHERPLRGLFSKCHNAFESLPQDADLFAPETMIEYFVQLYSRCPDFDKANIGQLLGKYNAWQFETAAAEFKMIADSKETVFVNYGECDNIIQQIKKEGPTYTLMRRLSKYSVNIYDTDFKQLCEAGCVEQIIERIYYISDRKFYSERTGLIFDNHWMEEILII